MANGLGSTKILGQIELRKPVKILDVSFNSDFIAILMNNEIQIYYIGQDSILDILDCLHGMEYIHCFYADNISQFRFGLNTSQGTELFSYVTHDSIKIDIMLAGENGLQVEPLLTYHLPQSYSIDQVYDSLVTITEEGYVNAYIAVGIKGVNRVEMIQIHGEETQE